MNRIIAIVFIYFLIITTSHAQHIVVEGVIKDWKQKQALPYANVFLKGNYRGTMTNQNGQFKIIIPAAQSNDSLVVSYIGYKSQIISISAVKKPLEFLLKEDLLLLSEVVVTGHTALSIVQKAIDNIPINYYTKPYTSKNFYRVTAKKNDSYIHLSEAVYDLYQSKIDKPNQQFRLEKMRSIKDERALEGIDLGIKPNGIFDLDLVNNFEEIALLSKKGIKGHTFEAEGSEIIDGREAYKIVFDQKGSKRAGYKGYMLIDKETFAFVYFNFGLSPKGIAYHQYSDAATRALLKIVGIAINFKSNQYQITYKKVGPTYYLNSVGNHARINLKSGRAHYNFIADTRLDYLVTTINTDNISPFNDEELLGKDKFIEKQHSIYDAAFWNDYTIVLPTNDFNEIARKLETNNSAHDFKEEVEEQLYQLPKGKSLRIDSILTFYNKKNLFSGNVLIAIEGQPILQKSYNNQFTKNTVNSQFRIGSLSKTFTAMLIAQLENENQLNYDDVINKYLPHYTNGKVTVSQLLSHQSGIPNYLSNQDYLPELLSQAYTIEEVVKRFCSDSLTFEPGSKFEYSNTNYIILSLIAEKVTGKSYSEILKHKIFEPLQMKDTYFGKSKDEKALVTAFMYGKPEITYNAQNAGGAGGITSTTADLLKWSEALQTERLLPKEKLDQLYKPQAEYKDWEAFYGYGWMIDRYLFSASKKHPVNYHPGTDFGFFTMFVKQPDLGITIILLCNTGDFPRFEMTELILNELNR